MTEKRDDLYLPSREFVEQAHIQSRAEYERMWKQSIEDPDTFWGYIAKDFHWFKPWTQVYRGEPEIGDNEWFVGGKTNICYNCLDAQIEKGRGDKVALLFQGEPEADCKRFTYNDLLKHVCRFANALKKNGVKKGDRIVLYLPMIWQLPVVMLACARIGAVHTVVFGGFSAEALADRMLACGAKKMVTTNGYWRSGQKINAKANADKACMLCANAGLTIDDVFVVDRMVDFEVPYITYRDTALSKELMLDEISDYCPAEKMDAEDPLFIMYTSGSTGSPKGTLHTTAGYMVYTYTTFKYIFDYKEDDIFFCTADIGWITGHSYIVYGPLLNGATTVMYESVPTYPEPDRFWHIIDKFKVTIFYTAPTVIRALMNQDIQWIEKHDLSTLRLLGSVGEPINPEAWHWYSHYVGHDRCPIVDTWWQTEAGGVLISAMLHSSLYQSYLYFRSTAQAVNNTVSRRAVSMICRLDALAAAARAISAGILPRSTRQESSRCTCWRMTRSSVSSFVCLSETRTVPKVQSAICESEGDCMPKEECSQQQSASQSCRRSRKSETGSSL